MQILLLVITLLLMPMLSQAQDHPQSLSILDSLKSLPEVKEGFIFDVGHSRGLNTLALEVANYKGFSLDLAWFGIDGIGGVLDYSLSSLPVQNIPVLKYVQYLNIGYGVGYRTLALGETTGNPKSDNQFINGPVLFAKLKF